MLLCALLTIGIMDIVVFCLISPGGQVFVHLPDKRRDGIVRAGKNLADKRA